MSHYAVAVFSDDGDFDRLLAPYSECNKKYFQFMHVDFEEIADDYRKFKENNNTEQYTLEDYIHDWGYKNVNGEWGYYENPNGFYDWYTLDGKSYMFDLKDDNTPFDKTGYYRKDDYDWYPNDAEDIAEASEFWDTYVVKNEDVGVPTLFKREYYLERYKTKEQYVREQARTVPYAFVTPDGVWHAPGRVGWFAVSTETADDMEAYYKEWDAWISSNANPYVSIVDCHI